MSQLAPAGLFAIAAVFGAFGQLLVKRGAGGHWAFLAGGALAFTAVLVLFTLGYRMGGRVGIVYPVYATTFAWVRSLPCSWTASPGASGKWSGSRSSLRVRSCSRAHGDADASKIRSGPLKSRRRSAVRGSSAATEALMEDEDFPDLSAFLVPLDDIDDDGITVEIEDDEGDEGDATGVVFT
jgi:hypothetical protein